MKIEFKYLIPKKVEIEKDEHGHFVLTWAWFNKTFPVGDYDGVIFHFTPSYRFIWGITKTIGGSRNKNNKEYPEFWVCDDLATEPAEGYPEWVNDFLRKMFHEHGHYDEDQDDTVGNVLTQNSVHDVDYKLKKIHQYHYLVDYRGKDLKEKVNKLVTQVIKLAKKYI